MNARIWIVAALLLVGSVVIPSGTKAWPSASGGTAQTSHNSVASFAGPTARCPSCGYSGMVNVVRGANGAVWFPDRRSHKIGFIAKNGAITEYPIPVIHNRGEQPAHVTLGPDGNVWFVTNAPSLSSGLGGAGYVTPTGTMKTFKLDPRLWPYLIAAGGDGNLWIFAYSNIGSLHQTLLKMTTSGTTTIFTIPQSMQGVVTGITAGPDGNIWYSEQSSGQIMRVTTAGTFTAFSTPGHGGAYDLVSAGDGYLYAVWSPLLRISTTGQMQPIADPKNPWYWTSPLVIGLDGNVWGVRQTLNRNIYCMYRYDVHKKTFDCLLKGIDNDEGIGESINAAAFDATGALWWWEESQAPKDTDAFWEFVP